MNIEENIVKWYPFKKGTSIFEIYNENSIFDKLNIELELNKCKINDFKIQGSYDYITLIGTFEYANKIIEEEKPYIKLLEMLKQHLKDNGKILLAIDNRLGVKYFAGNKYKNYDRIFDGLGSGIWKNKTNLLLKKEIEEYIMAAGFTKYKFYYPLPDYKFASTIFTDEYLPNSNTSKLIYPLNYDDNSLILYNEINLLKQLCSMGQFVNFTNSYFVEISNGKIENDIKFVNYNIFRKNKYKLVLTMKDKFVEKTIDKTEGIEQLNKIKVNIENLRKLGFKILEEEQEERIVGRFVATEELDKKIIKYIKDSNIDKAYEEIQKWYDYIKAKLRKQDLVNETIFNKYDIDISKIDISKLSFVKDGYIDLSFENVFCEEEYLFYDQEWYFENIPIEFILYRAINNLYLYNERELSEKLKKQDILSRFGISEYNEIFKELEEKIQKEIIDEENVELYRDSINNKIREIELQEAQLINTQRKLEQETEKLLEIIKQFDIFKKQNSELEEKYNILWNEFNTSRGWKIIKGIRKVLRGNKNEPKS